jgi:hypothetical protein
VAVDTLREIYAGERLAWNGSVSENSKIKIGDWELFGGDDREGGISTSLDSASSASNVDIEFGLSTQGVNPYLASVLGADVPAYRGLFGLVLNKSYVSANNTYLKPWKIKATRTSTGWEPTMAAIELDMNPAHIIRECLTNTTWGGLGLPESEIDNPSFLLAAATLYGEGFGLSFVWTADKTINDFIGWVASHIGAVCFFSQIKSKMVLKLLRQEDTSMCLVLNESNIIDLVSYAASSVTEAVNQVTIEYIDRENRATSVTVQDTSGLARMDGAVKHSILQFHGISYAELAVKVAGRELTQACTPLSAVEIVVNRTQYSLDIGDLFKFSWAELGIVDMVMRVSEIEYKEFTDNSILIKGVRDIFSLGTVTFSDPGGSGWIDPIHPPANSPYRVVREITWWEFTRRWGDSTAVTEDLVSTSTRITAYCTSPSQDAVKFSLYAKDNGSALEYDYRAKAMFSKRLLLPADLHWSTEVIPLGLTQNGISLQVTSGETFFCIGDGSSEEIVGVQSIVYDQTGGLDQVSVLRGMVDTAPISHLVGTPVWVLCDCFYKACDVEDRFVGDDVLTKMLPTTALGTLPLADADIDNVVLTGRMMRPHRPRNFNLPGSTPVYDIEGHYTHSTLPSTSDVSLTWSSTNHQTETVSLLIPNNTAGVLPVVGTEYIIMIYGETNNLLRTEVIPSAIAENAWTYTIAMEQADSGFTPPRVNTDLTILLKARLDGIESRANLEDILVRV